MIKRWLPLILVCACLAFIWGNSMLPGEESGNLSRGVLAWLVSTFPFLTGMGEHLLRKLGHFSEFAGLGFFLTWIAVSWGTKGIYRFTMPLLCGVLAAAVDETIQIYTPDRGSSLTDVWIDTAGATTGILVFLVFLALITWKGNKSNETNSGSSAGGTDADRLRK